MSEINMPDDILEKFNLQDKQAKTYITKMSIAEILKRMDNVALRISDKSNIYMSTNDTDTKKDCIDIIKTQLNDFSQMLRDLIIRISKENGVVLDKDTKLRRAISEFIDMDISSDKETINFLNNLHLRNEIIHDYFNYDTVEEEIIRIMYNYATQPIRVVEDIREYCEDKGFLDLVVYKDKL